MKTILLKEWFYKINKSTGFPVFNWAKYQRKCIHLFIYLKKIKKKSKFFICSKVPFFVLGMSLFLKTKPTQSFLVCFFFVWKTSQQHCKVYRNAKLSSKHHTKWKKNLLTQDKILNIFKYETSKTDVLDTLIKYGEMIYFTYNSPCRQFEKKKTMYRRLKK